MQPQRTTILRRMDYGYAIAFIICNHSRLLWSWSRPHPFVYYCLSRDSRTVPAASRLSLITLKRHFEVMCTKMKDIVKKLETQA